MEWIWNCYRLTDNANRMDKLLMKLPGVEAEEFL